MKCKRNKNKKIRINLLILAMFAGLITLISILFLNFTKAINLRTLENDVRVDINSELIYYLNVTYDGVDRSAYDSRLLADGVKSSLISDYLYIEDKLPDGLTFDRFITSEDGTVGAVNQITGTACTGYVVDDLEEENAFTVNTNGLHYDETTKTVSFKVKGLQAGCKLTVGIATKTPESFDDPNTPIKETRRDFYNFATAREANLTRQSNTVHVWMGLDNVSTNEVVYQYAEETPDNAPTLPPTMQYAEGVSVGLASEPYLEGYKFNGWTTEDATITSSAFRMPNKKVTLTGSFTKIDPYTVSYEIEGDIPDGYTPPTDKEYYQNDMVSLDSLEKGTELNGYRFLGWTLKEGNVSLNSENDFVMPEENVKFVGKFELMTYKVEYKFYDTIVPPNSEDLLPETKYFSPGTTITLETIEDVEGYQFLGWYSDDNFEMPEEDVIIYGEWKIETNPFYLEIEKNVISEKQYYLSGDTVKYAIKVTNKNDFAVTNVIIQEKNENAYFVSTGEEYELATDRLVEILSIPANGSVTLYAEYKVTNNDNISPVINEVVILGATADEFHELDATEDISDTASFKLYSKLNICKVIDTKTMNSYAFHITGTDYDSWVNVDANNCKKIYIPDGEYEISELIPQTNELDTITLSSGLSGSVNGNKATFTIGDSIENEITYTNKYKKRGFYKSNGEVKNVVEPKILNNIIKKNAVIDNIKSTYVEAETGVDFSQINSDTNGKGIYLRAGTENDENPIYYYRGEVTNNNVLFAGFCWKIVRTTETGGTKLIYNGFPIEKNDNMICINTGESSQLPEKQYFNRNANDLKYIGYTYDLNTDSNIKTTIDNWYKSNIESNINNKNYENYLEDTIWCNDRSVYSIENSYINYGTNGRLGTNKTPSLVCPQQADKYTLNSTASNYNANLNGNGILKYPIALLTADEVSLAGAAYERENHSYYLYTNQYFWLLSPSRSDELGVSGFYISYGGTLSYDYVGCTTHGVRPAISLKNGTMISGGDGTPGNPYIVE